MIASDHGQIFLEIGLSSPTDKASLRCKKCSSCPRQPNQRSALAMMRRSPSVLCPLKLRVGPGRFSICRAKKSTTGPWFGLGQDRAVMSIQCADIGVDRRAGMEDRSLRQRSKSVALIPSPMAVRSSNEFIAVLRHGVPQLCARWTIAPRWRPRSIPTLTGDSGARTGMQAKVSTEIEQAERTRMTKATDEVSQSETSIRCHLCKPEAKLGFRLF